MSKLSNRPSIFGERPGWRDELPRAWEPVYEEKKIIVRDTPQKVGMSYGLTDITIVPPEGADKKPGPGRVVYSFNNDSNNGGKSVLHWEGATRENVARMAREAADLANEIIWASYDAGTATPNAIERYELYKYPRFDPITGKKLPPLPRPTRAELRAHHDSIKKRYPMHYADRVANGSIVEVTDEELEAERLEMERAAAEAAKAKEEGVTEA